MRCPVRTALLPVNGRGLFASVYIPIGTVIFKAFNNDGTRTNIARYMSQTVRPNVMLRRYADGIYAIAMLPIFAGNEISFAI